VYGEHGHDEHQRIDPSFLQSRALNHNSQRDQHDQIERRGLPRQPLTREPHDDD
jgi:hypothetical protein